MAVFVLDKRKKPLMPCSEKRARKLLTFGRVAVRATGSFNIQTANGVVQGISHRYCKVIQRADGYGFLTVATRKELCDLGSHKAGIATQSALYLPGLKAEVSRAK